MYKLMAVDIDGTLLNSKGELTETTKDIIRQGVDRGLLFTIASGRPIQGVEYLNKMLNLDVPFITYNGAMIVMGKSKKVLFEQKLSGEDAKTIIELGQEYGTTVMVWMDNNLYVSRMDERTKKYRRITRTNPILFKDPDIFVRNGVSKVLWYDDEEKIGRYLNELGEHLSDRINYHTSMPWFLEFVDVRASKAIAMEKLGEHFNIKREEMIAVGDGFNDLSMIEYAGLGVAMANSPDAIKEKADYITLSNDEDGVAHVIRKFVLDY